MSVTTLRLVCTLVAAVVFAAGTATPAPAQTITLRGASQFDDTHSYNQTMLKFAEQVQKYYGKPVNFVLHRNRELGLEKLDIAASLPLTDLSDAKVRFAFRSQCFYSALDTLGLCQFVWGPSWQLYGPSETVELVRAGTGWQATMEELLEIGERKINLHRAFNAREGIGKAADVLPKKLFQPLEGKGPTAGVALTTEEFEHARESYYRLAGWDTATGYPTPAKLRDLGLDWLAEKVPAAR